LPIKRRARVADTMGNSPSSLEKEIGQEFPPNEHFFGLVNFGNTCYCNSVLQALYFCRPFREKVISYKPPSKRKENLLTCLADLFNNISSQKKRTGVLAPKKFVARLRKENEVFDNYMQQDAHEFLNFLLNTVADLLQSEKQKAGERERDRLGSTNSVSSKSSANSEYSTTSSAHNQPKPLPERTWIHDIFEGTLTNETKCLCCETISSKDESFHDLSVDIEQNTSIIYCLKNFSCTETLCTEHKYFCEVCGSKQEAEKRMMVKKLPQILALHLKRFKYVEQQQRYTKLSYRVAFPLQLRLFNTAKEAQDHDQLYDLVAVVVHCGSGPNRGHYITLVRSSGFWLLFDDDIVDKIEARSLEEFFGLTTDLQKNQAECGYILFYETRS